VNPRTETHRVVDVPLGGNRTLRVALTESGLVLASGFGEGAAFRRPHWCDGPLGIPATALPNLRRALEVLEASAASKPDAE
jgi:hypothetical protein